MRSFQSIIFIWRWTETGIFKSALVYLWSTFCHDLLCFKKYKSCLPDFSSKSLLVMILMFLFLTESFLLQRSNGISMTVALRHCFLAEIPDSMIPLTSSSGGLLFVPQRMKIYLILELLEKSRFFILHSTCWILSPGISKFKVLRLEKFFFFQISGYLPKLEIIELPISKIFDNDWFSKLFCSLNLVLVKTFKSKLRIKPGLLSRRT